MRLLFIWLALFLTSTVAKAVDAEAIKDPRLKQIAWSDPGKQELYTETNRPELYCLALNISVSYTHLTLPTNREV